ncbi:MAG: hypothetical protein A3F46_00105 [Legionellales bacterium RIFCSPHIGHO2_12_FULL_42_9]|nr:MAG: hypothetical protein A3F46_00105 [Legionellales bacterium RIFCSPHIGHO2_12_FULL_42_9]
MPDCPKSICLSVAAPAFNEDKGIDQVVSRWHEFLTGQAEIAQFEIIVCNDGSTDITGDILNELASRYPEVRPIHFSHNQGAAAALNAAIAKTQFEWVLLIDSDDQFPIENYSKLLAGQRASQALVISGIRNKKDNFFARFGSVASGFICNLVHGSQIKDFNSAFKLVEGPLLRSLVLEARGMNYSTEITSRLLETGALIVEVDIEHRLRTFGKSNLKLMRDSFYRFLFVGYISLRQLLLKLHIVGIVKK